ncbi:unnamed protein product [Rodentolepis nana]|uniref:Lipocln_cytosolic_FA-bd_dom domain-containing protein n=1 Tax=Rodentolepis nana TaxID=102285 RepID=A0A0R3TWQ5_RODNA|nr:unnamed protein product [Rodentolepis nana]
MEPFVGKWQLEKSQGFAELLKHLGVKQELLEIADSTINTIEILELPQGQYKFHCENKVQNSDDVFYLGKEFQEKTPDGRTPTSTITVDNGVMKHEQVGGGQTVLILRTIEKGQMKTVRR